MCEKYPTHLIILVRESLLFVFVFYMHLDYRCKEVNPALLVGCFLFLYYWS